MIFEILLGLVAAILSIWIVRQKYPNKDHRFWGTGLIVAAVIYVGFGLWGRAWDWLPMELLGVGIYAAFAVLAKKHSLIWLVVGWALHIGWDLMVHPGYVPSWYPGICLGFDIAIALYILWFFLQSRKLTIS